MKICPRDGALMATNDVDGYRYFSCEKCFGHWIPGHIGHRALKGPIISRLTEELGQSTIHCPACPTTLGLFRVEGCEVDACRICKGLWLDGDEILKLSELFRENSAIKLSVKGRSAESESAGKLFAADALGELILTLFIS